MRPPSSMVVETYSTAVGMLLFPPVFGQGFFVKPLLVYPETCCTSTSDIQAGTNHIVLCDHFNKVKILNMSSTTEILHNKTN